MRPAPRISDEITFRTLRVDGNLFAELSASAHFEDLGKGRRGATLTRVDEAGGVPLVRTTTRYAGPAQRFRALHERLARRVQACAGIPVGFDNALIESYTDAYRKMGSHSDQALDLAEESSIAVFSCYRTPEASPPRKLVFESKEDGGETYEIALTHNSVVAFSVASNRRFRHRIVLDAPPAAGADEHVWLGVTFRTSKTILRFRDGHPYLPHGARLTTADEEQRREFFGLRRRENEETDFTYPALTYTVSESDLMPPAHL
ncbi:alpha-ketoglutarate-dependent dioxygenase AlkB [Streptomyces roseolus]|uniref:alpha-ketoglutarate-dependent dioxygenase AlkB n=1 Tax=Streptomyces roseolus TaxID=67358 RepID=UPI0037BD242F